MTVNDLVIDLDNDCVCVLCFIEAYIQRKLRRKNQMSKTSRYSKKDNQEHISLRVIKTISDL